MKVRVLDSISDVGLAEWNAIVPRAGCPMLEHGYLAALERSGSLARGQLQPRHLTLWSGGRLVAAAPCYLKTTDAGDPLPDWAAKVAVKHELPYFPTVYVGIPFASAGGAKLLSAADVDRDDAIARLFAAAKDLAATTPSPVIHFYLGTVAETELLERAGCIPRISPAYAWVNEGYTSFDDFLARLKSKRRSAIRHDRRAVGDVRVRALRGADLDAATMDLMWRFHSHTIGKHGAEFDLYTREFFLLLGELCADRIVIFMAERGGADVAASMYVASESTLYSRTCGSLDDEPFLHFEVTWYQPLEAAIAQGLKFVDPGGPGAHKLSRGFAPIGFDHSATWIGDDDLREAAEQLIAKERSWMPRHVEEQLQHSALR